MKWSLNNNNNNGWRIKFNGLSLFSGGFKVLSQGNPSEAHFLKLTLSSHSKHQSHVAATNWITHPILPSFFCFHMFATLAPLDHFPSKLSVQNPFACTQLLGQKTICIWKNSCSRAHFLLAFYSLKYM